jgi:hypothetical protein
VLANTDGFVYHYKPYEPLNLDEWANATTIIKK